MRIFAIMTALFAVSTSAFASVDANNINIECKFRGARAKGKPALRCHAVANLHFQGEADHHLLVNCPGLGTDTIVYNGEAEFFAEETVNINPAGSLDLPNIELPGDALDCRQTPERFDAELTLPERAPYGGAVLGGRCKVVTAGCASPR